MKQLLLIKTMLLTFVFANAQSKVSNSGVVSIKGTKTCLVGFDWVYPSSSNPTGAWKFSSDGTFNFSNTIFGGIRTWGNWQVISPGKVKISYTRTTEGIIPDDQILTMSSCGRVIVGSTVYSKD
jgi:hypothetical protein